MAKPLRSESPASPKDVQFKHFGVLDSGAQSKSSLFTSVSLNLVLLVVAIIIGAAAKKTMDVKKEVVLVSPVKIEEKKPEPKPIPKPPKELPKPPKITPVEPKIKLPDVKIPDPPKIPQVKMEQPKPVIMPAMPKQVIAAAAPKPISVKLPSQSAAVPNNDAHPSAVALGRPDNPIAVSNRPATMSVNLGNAGQPNMPSGNTGRGNPTKVALGGNGQPTGALAGTGVKAVAGIPHGIPGGTGTKPGGNGIGTQVSLGQAPPPPPARSVEASKPTMRSAPKVTYKPSPVYTSEATAKHIEGSVSVRIRVSETGAVTVLGVTSGLGYGLDESAVRAVQGTRFQPALDGAGNPIAWEGVVSVRFQLAG